MLKNPKKRSLAALSILVCLCLISVKEPTFSRVTKDDKTVHVEKLPEKLFWGPSSNGLQMAVWVTPARPIVFGLIRNTSRRRIHYCDYLLGTAVDLYARKSPSSEWIDIPLLPVENQTYIGGLPCGSNDTLYPGEKMKASPTAYSRNRVKGNHTFEVDLEAYKFPDDWQGTIECKIVQSIFGGYHKDGYQGKVESTSFALNLPLKKRTNSQ